ncbi:penicillin-insensitive murein endopeptidase [Enhygromyxa salina]|uniref:Penicillin-insensitive murein endopeptidase n=1 Tax=Enhygromyxa salina TaxID=215803 RepID=A0A2S9XWT8_9BACT|nr:penicillin-insensitive murein endopeptidase [Enhygromyxa salina]
MLVPLACAYPLLDPSFDDTSEQGEQLEHATRDGELSHLSEATLELAAAFVPMQAVVAHAARPVEAEPVAPPPPPPPPTPEELAALLDDAATTLVDLEIKIDPRRGPRGPLPAASGLQQAYDHGRALVLEGRFEQIRQWMALAQFGSREPGPHCGYSPLSRYDLVVTRPAKPAKKGAKELAYLHVVVPARGLPKPGERGTHEAWIGDARWINLADSLDPTADYLPFKTNGNESLARQWAQADVVHAIVDIAGEYHQRTGTVLGIGDLSHVTGGKIEDHWTHQKGVDVDLYLLDHDHPDKAGRPQVWWNHIKRGASLWTAEPKGKGAREPLVDPADELSGTRSSARLEVLAEIVLLVDDIAYFVHNDPVVLDPFDDQAGLRRPGRRFLHADNRGFWPAHADHIHLRWVAGELPVGVAPRP